MTNKDAFDLWWEWAEKPFENKPTIDAAVYDAVMALPPDERRDRAKVNAAVRDGLRLGPLRPAGSADLYGAREAQGEAQIVIAQRPFSGHFRGVWQRPGYGYFY